MEISKQRIDQWLSNLHFAENSNRNKPGKPWLTENQMLNLVEFAQEIFEGKVK
jgi:hypothetical protein